MPTSAPAAFDQRAVVVAELRATTDETKMLTEALDARGWQILSRVDMTSEDPSPLYESTARYTLEVRFPGSRFRAAAGAREHIETLAEELDLHLQALVADRVERDPADLAHWFAYRPPATHDPAASEFTRRIDTIRSWLARWTGTADTGRRVWARTAETAQELAELRLPGVAPHLGNISVRRPDGTRDRENYGSGASTRGLFRRTAWLRFPLAATALCAALMTHGLIVSSRLWWIFLLPLTAAMAASVASTVRAIPEVTWWKCAVGSVVAVSAAAGFGIYAMVTAPSHGALAVVILVLVYLTLAGIRLLIRQLSWRALPWLLPALLPFAFVIVPGIGRIVHACYLDAFGLDVKDVDVPLTGQISASVKLLAAMSLWLLVLALWGYMRHLHLMVKDRWMGHAVIGLLSVIIFLISTLDLVVEPALATGKRAVQSAEAQQKPATYFGINAEWVCALPTDTVKKIPTRGGRLVPRTAYLMIGDADGTAVLWDAKRHQVIKAPLDKLRLEPTARPSRSCEQ